MDKGYLDALEIPARLIPLGRPTLYNDLMADKLVELIEGGATVDGIGEMDDMPAASTVRRWMKEKPAFQEAIARAREMGGDAYEARMLREMDLARDKDSAAVAKVRIDTLAWIAERRNPKRYGSKQTVDMTVTTDLASRVEMARKRTIEG